ncbi:MAG: class I SAM-dependent methyltransferase [Gammaproteobacteria bacterium]|nr:class I SAM-dependent methyltransferase [Gammaproteobacteria bacterium]MBU2407775.1 class I SAM-dependent methyltransferase [Gammaproteobacteria bacterium]
MSFTCNVCGCSTSGRVLVRGDGVKVLFCSRCDMGVIENIPEDTSVFYEDTYYGASGAEEVGYHDYEFTADHSLLWVRLAIEALYPSGRVLDIGCANGHLLRSLSGDYQRFGIEVNATAADVARQRGVDIVGSDVFDAALSEGRVGRFEVITSIATFEHVNDFKAAFEVSLGLLADEGVMIFEVPLLSDTRDNKDWLNASYEHVFYPTVRGLEELFKQFPDYRFMGFESEIAGYSSTYIGVAARHPEAFERVGTLFEAMVLASPLGLPAQEASINLAYNVVHSFNVTADRILALPALIERANSVNLTKRLAQLWHADRVAAENSLNERANAVWYAQQAANWEAAWGELNRDYDDLRKTNALLFEQTQQRSD